MEAIEEPGGAGGFAEGRRGNADDFELPLAELRLVEMQPVERAMHRGEGGEACDAALGRRGGGHQYSTSERQGVGSREWRIEDGESLRVAE